MRTALYASILLTEDDMAELDDGQGWYEPGDTVHLGGYLPEGERHDSALDLNVNGRTEDNWTCFLALPTWILDRLISAADHVKASD